MSGEDGSFETNVALVHWYMKHRTNSKRRCYTLTHIRMYILHCPNTKQWIGKGQNEVNLLVSKHKFVELQYQINLNLL